MNEIVKVGLSVACKQALESSGAGQSEARPRSARFAGSSWPSSLADLFYAQLHLGAVRWLGPRCQAVLQARERVDRLRVYRSVTERTRT